MINPNKEKSIRDKVINESIEEAWKYMCRVAFVSKDISARKEAIEQKEKKLEEINTEYKTITTGPDYHKKEVRENAKEILKMRDQFLIPALNQDRQRLNEILLNANKLEAQGEFFMNLAKFAKTWRWPAEKVEEKIEEKK